MIIKINPKIINFSKGVQKLCLKKGGSFSHGCPNYGVKEGCPPNQPMIDNVFDFRENIYLIYTEFNVGRFAKHIREKHPGWTDKQCYNPRYWQQGARKEHNLELDNFLEKYPGLEFNKCPEAHGINVDSLMKDIGVNLEWPPRNLTRIVSLGGFPKS